MTAKLSIGLWAGVLNASPEPENAAIKSSMSNADLSDSHPKKVQPHQKQTGKQNLSIYPNSNFIIFVLNIKKGEGGGSTKIGYNG